MRFRKFMCALALVAAAGCGGDGDGGSLPPELQPIVQYMTGQTRGATTLLQQFPQALVLALLDPVGAAAAGIVFSDMGGNTYDFAIPVDTDGDGTADVAANGTVTLNQAPVVGPNTGLIGTIDGVLTRTDGTSLAGSIVFASTAAGLEVSCALVLTDPGNDYYGEIIILDTEPIVVKAPGDGGAVANVCTGSGEGNAYVSLTNGTLAGASPFYFEATLEFLFTAANTSMTHIRFGETEGTAEDVSNQSVSFGCAASIQDWVGTFDTAWFCPPGGGGTETHTFTVTGPNTVQVSKADVGSSTPTVFTATALPGNPHVLVGEFTEGDPLYTETFVYTLSPDGASFTQNNDYVFIEGPMTGTGGPCYGTGHKR
jgi:hypothetical protein